MMSLRAKNWVVVEVVHKITTFDWLDFVQKFYADFFVTLLLLDLAGASLFQMLFHDLGLNWV